jgi:hypothetical protein
MAIYVFSSMMGQSIYKNLATILQNLFYKIWICDMVAILLCICESFIFLMTSKRKDTCIDVSYMFLRIQTLKIHHKYFLINYYVRQ